jgi:hypothetical protein
MQRQRGEAAGDAGAAAAAKPEVKLVTGDGGYVLEDVPHVCDYLPDLPVSLRRLPAVSSSALDRSGDWGWEGRGREGLPRR